MIDTMLAYLISLGMIGGGVGWIVVGMYHPICIGIGVASIAVGLPAFRTRFLREHIRGAMGHVPPVVSGTHKFASERERCPLVLQQRRKSGRCTRSEKCH